MTIPEHIFKYPAAFLIGLVVTYALVPIVIRVAPLLGYMDRPDTRRPHKRSTPTAGGIAVFFGFHAACAFILLVPWRYFDSSLDVAWWGRFALLSSLLLILGLTDDRFPLRPWQKLGGQISISILGFLMGIRFGAFLGTPLPPALDLAVTVLWILVFINAFNLIDGMDGVATGLAIVAGLALAGALLLKRLPGDVLILLGLVGACLAFLRYNSHPARIFLGDTGSMFLGFALAAISLGTEMQGTLTTAIAVPLLAVGVPIFDTVLAVWRRGARSVVANGSHAEASGIMSSDLDHLHHRLARSGMSHRRAAHLLYAIAAAVAVIGLALMSFRDHTLGIALSAFVVGTYVIVRHLAKVELWDTGSAILMGIRKPPRKSLSVFVHPPLDIAVLSAAFALAWVLQSSGDDGETLKDAWFRLAPFWIGLPFIAIASSGAYQRVWSRARISEFVLLAAATAAGLILGVSVTYVQSPYDASVLFQDLILYSGLAVPGVCALRAFRRVVQDTMAWLNRQGAASSSTAPPTLIYGMGYGATLFLRARSYAPLDEQRDMFIVGAMDDDPNLHGRRVHGCEVFGGFDHLEDTVLRHHIEKIVIATDLDPTVEASIRTLAADRGLSLMVWRTALVDLLDDDTTPPVATVRADPCV